MTIRIPIARPELGPEESAAVAEVLQSGMLVSGRLVEAFERGLAERCGRRYAVCVANGTAALELALRALGVDAGEVLVPALSWPSPAHMAAWVGATPRLVDVDPATWNGTAATLAAARSEATRCAIAIDQFGVPADHAAIADALGDLAVVEDAACAIGSTLDGRPCGSFGEVSCLSFHPRKVVTTGEGGACLTDDDGLADQLRVLRNHGQRGVGDFALAGPNERLTEMQAAIGLVQLDRLDAMIERRRRICDAYRDALPGLGLAYQAHPAGARVNEQTFGCLAPSADDRDRIVAGLREGGIGAGILSYAMTRIGSLAHLGQSAPVAEDVEARGLALPVYPAMTDADVADVLAALAEAVG
ncbi:MAG: DegT/DnrJ/EryC1/StrS family aminotransferase [Gaiellales bacterium]